MPQLLRSGAIERVRASQDALALALFGMARPETTGATLPRANSGEIGLVGSSAELALSACLFQIGGPRAVAKRDGRYPSAPEALAEFRRVIRARPPRVSALVDGVDDQDDHLDQLVAATVGFTALFTERAGGLHAGRRHSRAVVHLAATQVSDFLRLLAASRRWSPYLQGVPFVEVMPEKDLVLADELSHLSAASTPNETARALSSIFLVLPELCSDEPEWIEALHRVSISPRKQDLSVLLTSLETAHVGEVVKAARGARGLPVHISDDGVLTTSIANLKKSLHDPLARWRSQRGTANGCMDTNGYLDLPSIEAIYEYFALGLENMGFPEGELEAGLTAPDVWPFVAAALSYQGTPGPCFFLIGKLRPSEYSQFVACMRRAALLRGKLAGAWESYEPEFRSIATGAHCTSGHSETLDALSAASHRRLDGREDVIDRIFDRADSWMPGDVDRLTGVLQTLEDPGSLEPAFVKVIELSQDVSPPSCLVGIGRSLMHAATDAEDVAPMLEMAKLPKFVALRTDMRKAMREVDYLLRGACES